MAHLSFELVSPERVVFSGPVDQVVLPGTEGEMTVLANHAPMMTALRTGVVQVFGDKGVMHRVFVRGGFADVTAAGLTILASQAVLSSEINAEKVASDLKNAQEDLRDAKTTDARDAAAERVEACQSMLSALKA